MTSEEKPVATPASKKKVQAGESEKVVDFMKDAPPERPYKDAMSDEHRAHLEEKAGK